MGYVATKTRLINGTRYNAGDPVDTSDWDHGLIERMKDRRRIVWRDETERASETFTVSETSTATVTVQADSEKVYHLDGGYYFRVSDGSRVDAEDGTPIKGARRVREAGYEIVAAPNSE